ncbi:TPA: DUF4145 domain-containing protein [Citrobacter youngae]|uniref:DUF4145 domain-containing protein n=1 Tax=Citrobacter TaxID=544 RepID=UPI002575FB34|nr:DUF4145 domain-containing protein [Citrobacter sp. Cu233]MDM2933734.1 DUF4145 domain-containing protein [Citrobacter sp. Cu233]HDX4037666.1 DUF4145 domain-containing protein [Citrobacter youngae]HEF0097767.1 DUF4145 domain-containing protein [Citrobacter youngae]
MAYFHYFSDIQCTTCGCNASFSLLNAVPFSLSRRDNTTQKIHWQEAPGRYRGLFTCRNCHNPITIDFSIRNINQAASAMRFLNRISLELMDPSLRGTGQRYIGHQITMDSLGVDLGPLFKIDAFHPDSKEAVPSDLPPGIHQIFVNDLLNASGSPRLTLFSCRLIIEAACSDQLGVSGGKLVSMINQLGESRKLPEVMIEWAHTIRQFGNGAAHDHSDVPDAREASEIRAFTVSMLEFLYSHPARVTALRNQGVSA